MKRSSIVFLVVLFIILVGIAGVAFQMAKAFKAKQEATVEESVIPVVVMEVSKGTIKDIIDLTGWIEPDEKVNVMSKIPGKLTRNTVREGDEVGQDQTLAYVNRDEIGVTFAEYPVPSPARGIVAKLAFDPGAMVSPQFPLAVVMKIDRVRVKTSVIEQDYGKLRVGLLARVHTEAFPTRVFEGSVYRISPTLDSFSHTATVEILIPNPDHKLRPGMFTTIELVVDTHQGVPVLPKEVVVQRRGLDVVFTLGSDRVHMQPVKLGYYDLKRYEILDGVKTGDLVVTEDQAILQDGAKARIARKVEAGKEAQK
jgi:multidrug efflux pump subunit AcrA (membrane-fusion protein)